MIRKTFYISASEGFEMAHPEAVVLRGKVYLPEQAEPCLDEAEWEALSKAERPLFDGKSYAYTEVIPREESELAAAVWRYIFMSLDGQGLLDGHTQEHQRAMVASRTARVLGIMSFGTDWILR